MKMKNHLGILAITILLAISPQNLVAQSGTNHSFSIMRFGSNNSPITNDLSKVSDTECENHRSAFLQNKSGSIIYPSLNYCNIAGMCLEGDKEAEQIISDYGTFMLKNGFHYVLGAGFVKLSSTRNSLSIEFLKEELIWSLRIENYLILHKHKSYSLDEIQELLEEWKSKRK